jgi:hypothetical protein
MEKRKHYKTRKGRDPRQEGLNKFKNAADSGRRALDWAMRDLDVQDEISSLHRIGVIRREAIA